MGWFVLGFMFCCRLLFGVWFDGVDLLLTLLNVGCLIVCVILDIFVCFRACVGVFGICGLKFVLWCCLHY